MMMKLYGYWRSSAAYRVRIALNLKKLNYEQESVHLVKDGGQQFKPEYQNLNANQLVPTLVDDQLVLNQSLAILEYLEAKYPDVKLLPTDIEQQMLCRALAYDIAVDLHPLNNLRVLKYLTNEIEASPEQKNTWYHHWLGRGLDAFEKKLQNTAGKYCVGDTVTWVDICLVPQIYNAERFNFDLSPYPLTQAIVERLRALPEFEQASPERQPDAE